MFINKNYFSQIQLSVENLKKNKFKKFLFLIENVENFFSLENCLKYIIYRKVQKSENLFFIEIFWKICFFFFYFLSKIFTKKYFLQKNLQILVILTMKKKYSFKENLKKKNFYRTFFNKIFSKKLFNENLKNFTFYRKFSLDIFRKFAPY